MRLMDDLEIKIGDCIASMKTIPDKSIHTCVTSPPYFGLRDYGHDGQIGLEDTPDAFISRLVEVFREVRRVLRDDGTLWLNLGDSYAGSGKGPSGNLGKANDERNMTHTKVSSLVPVGLKPKDLIGIPWRVALALQADGWYLRQDIIWHKPNPMPESVTDRCTKSHEYVFLLSKSPRYYFDNEAIKEPVASSSVRRLAQDVENQVGSSRVHGKTNGAMKAVGDGKTRNKRSVWTVTTKPFKGAHFATFPPDLIEPCILAGCPPAGKMCDCDTAINTPTGNAVSDDPSLTVGRAGMSRPRRNSEGVRPITRRQQRHNADEMKQSLHREKMLKIAGPAFSHYIRKDNYGARPLPESLFQDWLDKGWVTISPPCDCPMQEAGTVLDPFGGSGTTAGVAIKYGRKAILCELNPEYANLIPARINAIAGDTMNMFSSVDACGYMALGGELEE